MIPPLNKHFRRSSVHRRREFLQDSGHSIQETGNEAHLLELADAMVENAVGYWGVPLGLASPLLVDDREYVVPMATEEPSVITAASFGGALVARHGGFVTEVSEPVMAAQIFMEDADARGVDKIRAAESQIRESLAPLISSMKERGGGWRGLECRWIAPSRTLAVKIKIDVRDAMGANLLNGAAEAASPLLERITGGRVLMAILSNRSWDRRASARFSIPEEALKRPGYPGKQTARRIVKAARVAREDPDRGITHNKGIMNGISALALATGNDTRAIEAAAHAYAGRYGAYHGLSEFWLENGQLHGALEMPLPFGVTGGAVGFHPGSRWSLDILGSPDAPTLSRIAAALGLAQNLAALRALVSEGIQNGHMFLHARRLAWDAGARESELKPFAALLQTEKIRGRRHAKNRYIQWARKKHEA